jgi:cyclic beta-1,2-glucan synthetase
MGWERKRGKLHEFNRLLRGDTKTTYMAQVGDLSILPQIRYVITLDADTVLPRGSAHRLIATLAHPLNRANFDPATNQVVAGYTLLQPRTEIKPVSANHSLFTRVFAGDTGLDLYTRAVSDVYQDLFGEGIYVGKGIYDVDAFERSLKGRVPENALLSHDLFEGIHGRAGLVTDVILYEDYPPHYLVHIHRSHRWIRGDWQLLPWLLPGIRAQRLERVGSSPSPQPPTSSPLSIIDRWKILDNLRRSLLSPALLLLFLLGWTWLPGSPLLWTLLGIVTPAGSFFTTLAANVIRLATNRSWRQVVLPLRDSAVRWLLALAFLPYETVLALDAIFTTLVRLLVTRRHLLQWTTAAHAARLFGEDVKVGVTRRQMLSTLLVTLILAAVVYIANPAALLIAAPLLITWLLSPEIAYWISRPTISIPSQVTPEQRQQLRHLARRTWLFFEQFIGPDDNWLPPDHFQEAPRGVVAHRTSPTNVGLLLLSTLTAYDLGYIDTLEFTLRLRSTFDTLARLESYRGHFLNWIDTRTLEPLPPRYVSTVDSGNLAVCLLALKQGCLAIAQQPVWRWRRWQGLLDALGIFAEAVTAGLTVESDKTTALTLQDYVAAIRADIMAIEAETHQWIPLLLRLIEVEWPHLDHLLLELVEANIHLMDAEHLHGLRLYAQRLHHHLQNMQREVEILLPWLLPVNQPPAFFRQTSDDPAVAEVWASLVETLLPNPTFAEAEAICEQGLLQVVNLRNLLTGETEQIEAARAWCDDLAAKLSAARTRTTALLLSCNQIAQEAETYFQAMDFNFLFNRQRQVFHIGYNLDTGQLDNSYYDLLASESRIASFVAIAKNDVPQSHWLHLARPLTRLTEGQTLLSWSGTMFEYLMPPLLMRSYEGTFLHQSVLTALDHQITYSQQKGVPWGISESGFYAFDANLNYQYRAFGIQTLGLKRGLADDLVITPYASLLALPLRPKQVVENMDRLSQIDMLGRYGFYEAADFTPARLALGQDYAIVRSYMAHHQGMIMLALDNFLNDEAMVWRFHAEPRVQSVELLLQERVPSAAPLEYPTQQVAQATPAPPALNTTPWPVPVDAAMPQVHFLSNGRYSLLLTSAGSSYSQWQDTSLTRWRADTTLEEWGCWLYVKDEESGALWSATYQPTAVPPAYQEVLFHPHMVEFRRRDQDITLHMTVVVAVDDDVEIRRVVLTNDSNQPRRLTLTTYAEVVLASQATDERHPAFVKLFVESEYLPAQNMLLFRRRPRSAEEHPLYLAHQLLTEEGFSITHSHESDRARFLGRGRTSRAPAALAPNQVKHMGSVDLTNSPGLSGSAGLNGTTGATLDPILSLGQTVELPPHTSVQFALVTLAARSRQKAIEAADRYRRWSVIDRAFTHTRSRSEQELYQLGMNTQVLAQVQQLLSLLIYPHRALRAGGEILATNSKGQPGLWAFGISGDYPILLVRLPEQEDMALLHELLLAHTYWRQRQLKIDLVILNQEDSTYGQEMQGHIFRAVHRADSENWLNRRGGIFILRQDQMSEADHILLHTAARVILDSDKGTLAAQLAGIHERPLRLPEHIATLSPDEIGPTTPPLPRPEDLLFDNGLGGFSADGREYLIYLHPSQATPAPWINVIANPDFGFLVSETGGGYTWAANSGENRLTPWRNDPVSDMPGEALYLRDEETAEVWSPTPQPAPASLPYLARHGAGYTIFEHHSHGLKQHLRLFAAPDDPVKVVQLRLENAWDRPRRLTITYYAEWVLGTNRENTQQYIVPEYDETCQALLAHNPYNLEFGPRVAFVAADRQPHGLTADRTEFLGRMGTLRYPAGLRRIGLENRVEAGLDTCAALQLHVDLLPGAGEEVYFLIGQGANRHETVELIGKYKDPAQVEAAWQATQRTWEDILGTIQVETPDPAMNLLLNRWLLYQALSCRIWGRSALYQSSGAYGFRDQLQDVMSLLFARPDVAREHILRAARHQFAAGDVLHWWHPPSGRGVRTRISDDLLWLPFVTAHYVTSTGDESILAEKVPFLRGAPLETEEEERYGYYESSEETDTLYEHCRRALQKGDSKGPHGLPLIGAGDWNDGMNRVGIHGQGESVWLGWFLYATLTDFAAVCHRLGCEEHAAGYRQRADDLRQAIEASGWDGQWYRRAYYDDGTPLGSAQNKECQLDSIAQSWAVLTHAADPQRARQSLDATLQRLIKWEEQLILLFTPPFDKTPRDPGYIKGYLPGIRENGGQYTHAALWTIWACAELGQGDLAESLFRLINPIYRADTPAKAEHYKVEPYVISADVYGVSPHIGRGGWTWYTGSSGWMYRLGLEAILGLRRVGQALEIKPCIPPNWPGYTITYRCQQTYYEIHVENPAGGQQVKQVTLDGQELGDSLIPLSNDGRRHRVQVMLG